MRDGWVDLSRLEDQERGGWLRRRRHGDYVIWDYTQKTQAARHWTPETRLCRGLVATEAGQIVSRPFPKFFNAGEEGPLPTLPFPPVVYEKLDGSLIVVSQHEGQRIVSSRAAMDNPHTRAAEAILGDWMPRPGWTYCFELIHPDMRIVCDYGDRRDLVLLGCIETATGWEQPLWLCDDWPVHARQHYLGWPFDPEQHAAPNHEGFVLHWPASWDLPGGLRVKVKFAEYLRLHRLLTGVTPRVIWEHLRDGKPVETLYENVPDEFYDWVRGQAVTLLQAHANVACKAVQRYNQMREFPSRAEQARELADDPHRAIVFHLLDGKDANRLIWEMVKPGPAKAFWNSAEAA